jgi:selenide,water dikinase
MTDVTGFGLLGHLLEVCRGSHLGARVRMHDVPILEGVIQFVDSGVYTGASARNWTSYGAEVRMRPHLANTHRTLLCDPQTSGGLLVTCAQESLREVIEAFRRNGCIHAAPIGTMVQGEPVASVE